MAFEDRLRAGSFGEDAAQYDRARPGYPAANSSVVDVGCGTGIVARLLMDRGCAVMGVEPDPSMSDVARHCGVDVEISTFEEWDSRGGAFDMLTAGQSWHWVQGDLVRDAVVIHGGTGSRGGQSPAAGPRQEFIR